MTTSSALADKPVRRMPRFDLTTFFAVGLVVAVVVVHLYVALNALAPVYWEDEAGYLLNAQTIAGFGNLVDLQGMSYYPGWSLFLVPLWWIIQDPELVYRAAVVLAALFGIATAVPLAFIARRFGLTWPQAVIAGSVVVLGPGRVLMSGFALSENCLAFFFALTVLLALRYAHSPSWKTAAVFGAVAGFTFIVHGRAVPVVIATAIWFGWQILTRHWHALAGVASLGVVTIAGIALYRWSGSLIYPTTGREADGIEKVFTSSPLATIFAGAGQMWFHIAATLGLVAFGVFAVAVLTFREIRARRPAAVTWLSIMMLGLMTISFTYISGGVVVLKARLDVYVYGRYLDPFMEILCLAGAIVVLRLISRKTAFIVAGVSLTLMAIYVILGRILIPGIGETGWWAPLNVLGLIQYDWPGRGSNRIPFLWPSVAAAAGFALIYVLRRKPVVVLVAFAVFLSGSSLYASHYAVRPFETGFYKSFAMRDIVREYTPDHTLSFDNNGIKNAVINADTVSRNAYQYWLVPYSPPIIDTTTDTPTTELVISRLGWERADELGARLVAIDTGFDNALWVMPGALQEELEAQGKLLERPVTP